MTREEMLQMLHTVPFALIDPAREWEDIGFTERDIWVNAKGYGWISCDEPTTCCEVRCPELNKWMQIRKKLSSETLSLDDIKGTDLIDLLNEITYGDFSEDFDNPCDYLKDLLNLPDQEFPWIYGMDTFDGWQFFASEEEFKKAYERDWCDVAWEELSDDMLAEWIERLSEEDALYGKYGILCIPDNIDLSFDYFVESLDTAYLGCFVSSDELDTYLTEACEQLKEKLINEDADVFYDRLWDLYADGEANGDISYHEAYSRLLAKTEENIRRTYKSAVVKILLYGANGVVKAFRDISIADIMLELLEHETEGREFDAKVGQYIEASLIKYVDSSKWHLGYQYQDESFIEINSQAALESVQDKSCPIMWFGPDGSKPIKKWLLSCIHNEGFSLDYNELLYYLVDDCDDCFEIWYFAECGYCLPDMEAILAECPIMLSDEDTNESINRKFTEYFRSL